MFTQPARRLASLVIAASLLPTLAWAQSLRPLTVDDMFEIQRVGDVQISPDGKWVAFTVTATSLEDEKSETRVWMISTRGGDPFQ